MDDDDDDDDDILSRAISEIQSYHRVLFKFGTIALLTHPLGC